MTLRAFAIRIPHNQRGPERLIEQLSALTIVGLVEIDFCVALGNTSHGNRPREDRHALLYFSFNLNTT